MVSFTQIMLFYVFLTIALAFLGNFLLGYEYYYGAIVGLVVSAVLWFTVGKNMVS